MRHRLSADHLQRFSVPLTTSFNLNYRNRAQREKKSFTYSGNPIIVLTGHSDVKNDSVKNKFSEVIPQVINIAFSHWWDGRRWCVITSSQTSARTEHLNLLRGIYTKHLSRAQFDWTCRTRKSHQCLLSAAQSKLKWTSVPEFGVEQASDGISQRKALLTTRN